jgi:hypothetical protein
MSKNKLTPKKEAGNTTIINGKVPFENGMLKIPKGSIAKNGNTTRKRKIECTGCHAIKGISKCRLERNLKKFKTEEEFRSQYLCRECRPSGNNRIREKENST